MTYSDNIVSVEWPHVDVTFTNNPTPIGLIVLATDRVSGADVPAFFPPSAEAYVSRIPMSTSVTAATLEALASDITGATELLVPGGPLESIGFSCTSGTAAVGVDRVHERIASVRPDTPISTPIEAGAAALHAFGTQRIALLTPYVDEASRLIEAYFSTCGIDAVARGSFKLGGDPDMNRVSPEAIIAAGVRLGAHADADALFISCTGLRTRHVVEPLEAALGKPVFTSNQVLAWDLLRKAGVTDRPDAAGMLFSER